MEFKFYGGRVDGVCFVGIENKVWEFNLYYEDTCFNRPCDCCVSNHVKEELRKDGIILWKENNEQDPRFYHNREDDLPTEDVQKYIIKYCKEKLEIEKKNEKDMEEKDARTWEARKLLEKCRLADCEIFCRIFKIDFEKLCEDFKNTITDAI